MTKVLEVRVTGAPLSHRKHSPWNASSVGPAFNSMTLWHHTFQLLLHKFMAEVKLTGSWKLTEPTGDTVSGAGSDMCELTNQIRLGIQEAGLKETGAISVFISGRGGAWCRNWCVFLSIEACKNILVVNQNKIIKSIIKKVIKSLPQTLSCFQKHLCVQ